MTIEIDAPGPQSITTDDVDAIAQLLPQLSARATFDPERLDALISSDDAVLFVARDSGRIVGIATLVTFPLVTGWRGIVEDVVVDEGARGQGIARRLLQAIIAESRRRRLRTLDLTSRPTRGSALRLYESLGFVHRETNVLRLAPSSI